MREGRQRLQILCHLRTRLKATLAPHPASANRSIRTGEPHPSSVPTPRHQFDRSGTTFFGSDARNNTIQTQRRTTSLYKNSSVRFHAIGSVERLHLTTPGVVKKNDHVIANVPIPINEPSADRIGINAPAARRAAVVNSTMPSR